MKMSPDNFDPQQWEAELDQLVDAELPEEQRRTLLRQLAAMPDGWRTLALRFLQRQVEKQATCSLLQALPAEPPRHHQMMPTPAQRNRHTIEWPALKWAAVIVLTAGLFGLGGAYFGRRTAVSTASSSRVVATKPPGTGHGAIRFINGPLPGGLANNQVFPPQGTVPVVDPSSVPMGYPFSGLNSANAPGRVMIVPEGGNQAVAFPVEEVSAKKVY